MRKAGAALLALISVIVLVALADTLRYLVFPDVSALKNKNPEKTAFMKYREKKWRASGLDRKRALQRWVPYGRVSPYLVKAVLIAEDDKFWRHDGFDFQAIERAVERALKEKRFRFGGSTISQQLAKNLYLSPSRSPSRKLKEAILTWRLERALTKKRILELYLNVAEWGDGIFGIEAAARHYYGKPASELGPGEAARLAAILPSPLRLNPLGSSRYVEKRSKAIYSIMLRRGVVEEVEEEKPPAEDFDSGAGEAGQEKTPEEALPHTRPELLEPAP